MVGWLEVNSSIQHLGQQQDISVTTGQISLKFDMGIHVIVQCPFGHEHSGLNIQQR